MPELRVVHKAIKSMSGPKASVGIRKKKKLQCIGRSKQRNHESTATKCTACQRGGLQHAPTFTSVLVRMGNHAKRANVRCAPWMMRAVFVTIRLGPKTSVREKHVSVKPKVAGCGVTYCATTLQGFNKQCWSCIPRRDATSTTNASCTEELRLSSDESRLTQRELAEMHWHRKVVVSSWTSACGSKPWLEVGRQGDLFLGDVHLRSVMLTYRRWKATTKTREVVGNKLSRARNIRLRGWFALAGISRLVSGAPTTNSLDPSVPIWEMC